MTTLNTTALSNKQLVGIIADDVYINAVIVARQLSAYNIVTILCADGSEVLAKYDEFYRRKAAATAADGAEYNTVDVENPLSSLPPTFNYKEADINFIITDYNMPIMKGDQVVNMLRERPNFVAKTICMTGEVNHYITGFDAVLIKPINEADIIRILSS